MPACFTGTKVLAVLVQKYLLAGTQVYILTPEELLQALAAVSTTHDNTDIVEHVNNAAQWILEPSQGGGRGGGHASNRCSLYLLC